MSPWRQISPQQLLAQKNPPPEIIAAQRNALIESLKDFHIRQLLELEQKLDTSLPLLLHEAIADLIDKYKHIK
jgi:hypothetical protein